MVRLSRTIQAARVDAAAGTQGFHGSDRPRTHDSAHLAQITNFGDGWQHTIKLESVSEWDDNDPLAQCIAGRRACPPEDIGGPWGYAEVVDALNGQIKAEHAEFMKEKLAWLPTDFDPEWFSVDEVNQMLAQPPLSEVLDGWDPHIGMLLTRLFGPVGHTAERLVRDALVVAGPLERNVAAASVRRFQVLLEAVGDGVKLTQAGWLPPALVRDIAERLELGDQWIRPANREDQTFPVAQLRQAAMDVGLLRKSKGVLSAPARVRKMIDSPEKLLDHIAERMPVGRQADQQDAGLVVLLAAAAGRSSDLSSRNLGAIFWASGWQTDDDPDLAFHESAEPTLSVLSQLAGGHPKRVPVSVARRMLREDGV